MIERERTFLAKYLPKDLLHFPTKEIIDVYVPKAFPHPQIRIRKNGDKYEITKKVPAKDDCSNMLEQTIPISEKEFVELEKLDGKRLHKIRYLYPYDDLIAEFDVFLEALSGLVIVDFEFKSNADQKKFTTPDFCLAEITIEQFTAGGAICGKTYADIKKHLDKYGYKKILLS